MLDSHQIRRALERVGLQVERDRPRIKGLETADGVRVYLKTAGKDGSVAMSDAPLVLNPALKAKSTQINEIEGISVDWLKPYHNSNMAGYAKRLHTGKEEITYGFETSIASEAALHALLAVIDPAAYQSGLTAYDEIDEQLKDLPSDSTTRKALIDARLDQGKFRKSLIDYWSSCAVTGANNLAMLRASHAKPWKVSTNEERLDVYNGLLLTANLDAAFDAGLITFEESGAIRISRQFADAAAFGIRSDMRLRRLEPAHARYLEHHRERVFESKTCP
ncbi:HNH endonuclease signature motif containing protein [uncultured Salinisphaera sp.]|uniref:HNH endonuclease n=1 Tax=uncultured Salinisphaera sp. TaxID=359372 RepID=UPI0032B18F56